MFAVMEYAHVEEIDGVPYLAVIVDRKWLWFKNLQTGEHAELRFHNDPGFPEAVRRLFWL
jgi:hypothetical protein